MEPESKVDRGSLNEAVRESLARMPDPLHFELPHPHKKLLEALYIAAILGAVVSVLAYGMLTKWPSTVVNATVMIVMALSVILGVMLLEKSSIAHKPSKSSS